MAWAIFFHSNQEILIQSGRPMHKGHIESFNGKFNDECLNEQWFPSLPQAVLVGFLFLSSPSCRGFNSLLLIPTEINFLINLAMLDYFLINEWYVPRGQIIKFLINKLN